jgi:hypothetical protein
MASLLMTAARAKPFWSIFDPFLIHFWSIFHNCTCSLNFALQA